MFKDMHLLPTYSTYENDISEDFYIPVLSRSIKYDRVSAYFSAKSLANYARGLEVFAAAGNKFRLVISSEIEEHDFDAIKNGYKLREYVNEKLISQFNVQLLIDDVANLSNLAYLISIGIVDIKMAFTKKGIFHDKFGILEDAYKNFICFRGSNNETNAAYNSNYESFDITCSWLASEFDLRKIPKSISDFESLWANKKYGVHVLDIDDVIKNKILEFNRGSLVFEPILLNTNCLILDYVTDRLNLIIRIDSFNIRKTSIYKLFLKHYCDMELSVDDKLIFNNSLRYPIFKQIINKIQENSQEKDYIFFVTKRLDKLIKQKELHVNERASVGLAIKDKSNKVQEKYNIFKAILKKIMIRELREQQIWDSFYMYVMRKSANFSVPGSGKTSAVLGVYAYLKNDNIVDKLVVICPKNAFISWSEEYIKCFNNDDRVKFFNISHYHSSIDRVKALSLNYKKYDVFLLNYEIINSVISELKNVIKERTLLVFDEVHKVKNPDGCRAKDALEIAKDSNYTIVMTGTPIPNSYLDIRNILNILYNDEYDDYFNFSETKLSNPNEQDIKDINNKLRPFFCRTTKKQLNVPEPNKDIIIKTVSNEHENKIFQILLLKYANNKLALLIRILQLESNPRMLLESISSNLDDLSQVLNVDCDIDDFSYVDYSEEVLTRINSIEKTSKFSACIEQALNLKEKNEPVIIWCIFINSITEIEYELSRKGVTVACIHGNVEIEHREKILKLFNEGNIEVLITNPHTLAESVSLHHICHNAIYFEYSYNLIHLLQSKDRIHRLGLADDEYTQYYYLQNEFLSSESVPYSLDRKIYDRLHEKESVMLQAIEHNEFELPASSDEDINFIFKELKL